MSSSAPSQAALKTLAEGLALNCPDLRQQARQIAQTLLAKHQLDHLDPDTLYWHRFVDQVSSPRAFSGWVHYQRPIQSLTMTELVMARFSAEDSINEDALDTQTGFYKVDAQAQYFDERNEVPLLPSEALALFWATDFKQQFEQRSQQFWANHAQDYRALAKATAMAEALQARQHGTLSDLDLKRLFAALTGPVQAPATEAMLRATHTSPPTAHVSFLRIGHHQATDILHLVVEGTHYLYAPGEPDPWQAFENLQALHWWLLLHNNHPENRARFASHFALRSALAEQEQQPLSHTLDLLYSTWGNARCPLLDPPSAPIRGDAFTAMAERARARMHDDAELRLTSNATLRNRIWLGYLGAFDKVFGPLAALDWPVTLACVGAGLTEVGLSIDLAIKAPTTEQRHQAVTRAILASVDVLFNGLFLWGAWHEAVPAPAAPAQATVAAEEQTLEALTPERLYPTDTDTLLEHFESNVLLGNYQPASDGALKGVYTIDGQFYIELGGFSYQVRRASAIDSWVIIDPTAPYAFQRNVPVRLNDQGTWELTPRPGLRGGGQGLGTLTRPRNVAPAYAPLPASVYELAPAQRPLLAKAAADANSAVLDGDAYDFIYNPVASDALANFRQLRTHLEADAKSFFRAHPLSTRSTPPPLPTPLSTKTMLRTFFDGRDGLVLGEVHGHEASKRFLIQYMGALSKAGVNTLYMEHLLTDFHAADLAVAFERKTLTPTLEHYLDGLDTGYQLHQSTRYTFRKVIKRASEHGIRVVPLDCLASYRIRGLEDPYGNLRQQMMNYYAHQVIQADQAARGGGRWVALVGNSHASAFRGIPGLDSLEGALSVRFEDVPPGSGEGLTPDPGRYLEQNGLGGVTLRSDYLYRNEAATMAGPVLEEAMAQRLSARRSFLISPGDEGWRLALRLPDNRLLSRPVLRDGNCVLVNLPELPQLHHLRYTSLTALANDLKRLGFNAAA